MASNPFSGAFGASSSNPFRSAFGADDEWEERGILLVNKKTGETKPKPIQGGKPAYTSERGPGFLGSVGRAVDRVATSASEGLLAGLEIGSPPLAAVRAGRGLGTALGGGSFPRPGVFARGGSDVLEAMQETPLPGAAREEFAAGYERAKERFAEVPLPPLASATASTALDVAGQSLSDPGVALGGIMGARALQRGLAPRSVPTPARTPAAAPAALGEALAHAGEDVSPEALRRVASGQRFYRVRPGGEAVPILSDVGAVDVRVNPGEVKVAVGADGVTTLLDGRPNAAQQRRIAAGFEAGPVRPAEPAPEVELDLGATAGDEDFLRSMGVERPAAALAAPPKPAAAEAGHIRTGGLKDWLESNLLSGGPFRAAARGFVKPEQREFVRGMQKAKEGMEGRVASRVQAARFAIKDLEDAVRASTPDEGAARKLFQDLYDVRLRRKPWREVPEAVRPFAKSLFKIVDRTSVEMRDAGALPPSLKDVVTKRLGRYFHRGYAAFDDPRWREKMEGGEAWREAEGFLKGELPDAEPAEIQGILNALTDREQGVRRFLVTGGAPTRVNAILQKRQAIPEPLRRLMGEYTDVRQVAEKTVESMAYDLEVYKLLRGMKDKGEALGVFRQSGEPSGEVYRKILGPDLGDFGDRHPLSDMLTTPGLKKALVGTFEEAKYTTWNKAAGWIKAAKTVGSVQTHARNFLSHTITSVANGRNPVNPNRWSQVRGLFADRAQRLRSIELGILGEGAMSREVSDYLKMVENPEAPLLVRGAVRGGKALQRLYRLEDDLWRTYNWLGETEDLMRAKGLDLATAQAEAADRVRNTFQTYGRAPQVAEKLRRNPLFGAFPTFYIESVRNVGNIARIGLGDLREGVKTGNPELVKLGVRRFMGLATGALAATGLGTLGRAKTGMSDEQEAAFRRQVAPHYLRNAELVFTDYVPGSEAQVFDFSFMNPYSGITKSAIATMRSLDEGKVPLQAVTEFLEQVAGTEILASAALELGMNRRIQDTLPPKVGGEVYSTDMGPARMWGDIGYEAYRSLAPGAALTAENVARGAQGATGAEFLPSAQVSAGIRRELGTELLAVAGPRVTTFNMETAFRRRIRDIGDRYGKVAGRTKSEAKRVGPEPSVARDYTTGTVNLWKELDQIVKDARTLEVPEGVLVEAMRDARLSRWFRSSFLGSMPDVPPGIEVDPETYDLIRQAYSRRRVR